MKNTTYHEGTLSIIKRLESSTNGNPRYLLEVAGFTCRTAPDSSLAYDMTDYDGIQVKATIGTYYGKATLNSVKEL